MKLQVAVVALLLPVLFSTTDSPSHFHQMVGVSPIARRSRSCIQSQVLGCLNPHGSLPVPSMNHTTIKLLSDLLQLTDQPVVAKMMVCSESMPQLVKKLFNPVYLITTLTVYSAIVGAVLCTTHVITMLAYCLCSSLVYKLYPSHKSYRSAKMKSNTILKEKGQLQGIYNTYNV